jgi:type IV pilus assembly protein PilW
VRIYYISTCSNQDDCTAAGADNVPTLRRVDVKPTGRVVTALVDGIENIQFDYGRDTTASPGDGSPDVYDATGTPPTSVADWGNVMTVRIHVLARNIDPTGTYTDAKTYALGDISVTPPGGGGDIELTAAELKYKRHAYSEVARLNNPAGRRE